MNRFLPLDLDLPLRFRLRRLYGRVDNILLLLLYKVRRRAGSGGLRSGNCGILLRLAVWIIRINGVILNGLRDQALLFRRCQRVKPLVPIRLIAVDLLLRLGLRLATVLRLQRRNLILPLLALKRISFLGIRHSLLHGIQNLHGVRIGIHDGFHILDADLSGVDAVHQLDGLAVGTLTVGDGDGQLLHLGELVDALHGVLHIDVHVLGQLIQGQVPGVPQLQGLVAIDGLGADLVVQIPDVGEELVDLVHGVGQLLLLAVPDRLELLGGLVEELGQGFGLGPDQAVGVLGADLGGQLLQGREQVAQLGVDDAEAVVGLGFAHLIQNAAELGQAVQPLAALLQLAVLVPVPDIQIGVPQLGGAVGQDAVADVGVVKVGELGRAGGIQAHQVHPLAGVARGVDVGNIVAGDVQRRLGGVNRQAGGSKRAKGSDNSHTAGSPSLSNVLCVPVTPGNRPGGAGLPQAGRPGPSAPARWRAGCTPAYAWPPRRQPGIRRTSAAKLLRPLSSPDKAPPARVRPAHAGARRPAPFPSAFSPAAAPAPAGTG